jgi:hypothetical protein
MGVAYLWPPRLSGSYYPRKEVLVQIVSKKIRLAGLDEGLLSFSLPILVYMEILCIKPNDGDE